MIFEGILIQPQITLEIRLIGIEIGASVGNYIQIKHSEVIIHTWHNFAHD